MLLDFSPLKRHREYRLLYIGQTISFFGSMITYVALPYQIFQLTHSSFAVGMLGLAQLIPLLATAFIGGALADVMDRRKLLLYSESALTVCSALLIFNATATHTSIAILYLAGAMMSALNGIHRPALNALTPRLVSREEIPAMSALSSLRANVCMIGGPGVGGLLIAHLGLPMTYAVDALSFLISLTALAGMQRLSEKQGTQRFSFQSVAEGFRYARSRQELMGTYWVDLVAMVFGMPTALFPALSVSLGGAQALGWLYSAPSLGALGATLLSGSARKVHRHGAAVVVAAFVWGLAIIAFGLCRQIGWALFFLAIAGAADMVSALYRSILWNETIPDRLRGRLAAIEMVSYTSGPLLGNVESGVVAAAFGVSFSVISGGVLCAAGILLCIPLLPRFWNYDARRFKTETRPTSSEFTLNEV